jgi:hypothetical protein
MKKVKTITSHAGYGRWMAECMDEPVGYIARSQVAHIPSPYAYSPCRAVYEWNGKYVVSFETRHKRYEVFELPDDMKIYETDEEATEAYIASMRVTA